MADKTSTDKMLLVRFRVTPKDKNHLDKALTKEKERRGATRLPVQTVMVEALNDWLEKHGHRKLSEAK